MGEDEFLRCELCGGMDEVEAVRDTSDGSHSGLIYYLCAGCKTGVEAFGFSPKALRRVADLLERRRRREPLAREARRLMRAREAEEGPASAESLGPEGLSERR